MRQRTHDTSLCHGQTICATLRDSPRHDNMNCEGGSSRALCGSQFLLVDSTSHGNNMHQQPPSQHCRVVSRVVVHRTLWVVCWCAPSHITHTHHLRLTMTRLSSHPQRLFHSRIQCVPPIVDLGEEDGVSRVNAEGRVCGGVGGRVSVVCRRRQTCGTRSGHRGRRRASITGQKERDQTPQLGVREQGSYRSSKQR